MPDSGLWLASWLQPLPLQLLFPVSRSHEARFQYQCIRFAIFLIFLLVFSNASFLFKPLYRALGGFAGTFIERILITGESVGTQWPQWWTTFYWFSWMAWAPTSGAFMGQIAYGRKVKHVLGLYVGLCASVSAIWMVLVSGTSLWVQTSGLFDLVASYDRGVENVPYDMLGALPLGI